MNRIAINVKKNTLISSFTKNFSLKSMFKKNVRRIGTIKGNVRVIFFSKLLDPNE